MSLLLKLFAKKQTKHQENFYNFFLNGQIKNLNDDIKELSLLRKSNQRVARIEKVDSILTRLNYIANSYSSYIYELKCLQKKYETHKDAETKEQIKLMLEKKQSLRADFEHIYLTFKKHSPNYDDIPYHRILKLMLTAFDFDNAQYHSNLPN